MVQESEVRKRTVAEFGSESLRRWCNRGADTQFTALFSWETNASAVTHVLRWGAQPRIRWINGQRDKQAGTNTDTVAYIYKESKESDKYRKKYGKIDRRA